MWNGSRSLCNHVSLWGEALLSVALSLLYLQNSTRRLNKQEELLSGCSICIRVRTHVQTHVHTEDQTNRPPPAVNSTQTDYAHSTYTHQRLLSGLRLLVASQVRILIRGRHPRGYSCDSFHYSSGPRDAKSCDIMCRCRGWTTQINI